MEDRTLRDVERWKDKIEIRLDNRQVFFLFFGSALVACLLFILGVVVGKRLESRGRAASPEIEDPLALLDRIAATPGVSEEGLTFPKTLIQSGTKPKAARGERAQAVPPPVQKPARAEEAQVEGLARAADVTENPALPPKVAPVAEKPAPTPAAPQATRPEPVREAVAKPERQAGAPEEAPARGAEAPKSTKPEPEAKGKFTLQLASFQSREEAEAFMGKFAGESAFLVSSDIPGKGVWFRVRLGNYATSEAAMQAKAEFERKHHQIAYVAPR